MESELKKIIRDYNNSNTSMSYHQIAATFDLNVFDLLKILGLTPIEENEVRFVVENGDFNMFYVEITNDIWIKTVRNLRENTEYIEYSDGQIVMDGISIEFAKELLRHKIIKHW